MSSPALIRVRLRAIFGVGARAEILHAFVAKPMGQLTAAELARLTGYTKRNVTDELERLDLAGLLQVAAPSNQYLYRLHNRDGLLAFVGDRPRVFPSWEPLLRVVMAIRDGLEAIEAASTTVRAIELEKLVSGLEREMHDARIGPPVATGRHDGTPDALDRWAVAFMRNLASGESGEALEAT